MYKNPLIKYLSYYRLLGKAAYQRSFSDCEAHFCHNVVPVAREAFHFVSRLHGASPARSAGQDQVSPVQSHVLSNVFDDSVDLKMHVLREILLSGLSVRLL